MTDQPATKDTLPFAHSHPDVTQAFVEAGRALGNALEGFGFALTAQGALGCMLAGDEAAAREALARLNPEQRRRAAQAAADLAQLARTMW